MISSFNEYQEEAMKTAVYPNIGNNLAYPVLGLIDEYGEYLIANESDKYGEISDLAWYVAATATEMNVTLDELNDHFDGGDIFLDLFNLAGIAKKAMRDNGGVVQESKRQLALAALGRTFAYLRAECVRNGWNIAEVLQYNLDKLADRQSRNVIKGDGDYR